MDKFSFIALWDAYRGLLTSAQQEITDMYFNLDLTISEIAAEKGVSRQAVSECMQNCKKQLEEYESKLGFCRILREQNLSLSFLMTDAGKWIENFKSAHPEFTEDLNGLKRIIEKDYADEAEKVLSDPEKVEIFNGAAVKHGLKVE